MAKQGLADSADSSRSTSEGGAGVAEASTFGAAGLRRGGLRQEPVSGIQNPLTAGGAPQRGAGPSFTGTLSSSPAGPAVRQRAGDALPPGGVTVQRRRETESSEDESESLPASRDDSAADGAYHRLPPPENYYGAAPSEVGSDPYTDVPLLAEEGRGADQYDAAPPALQSEFQRLRDELVDASRDGNQDRQGREAFNDIVRTLDELSGETDEAVMRQKIDHIRRRLKDARSRRIFKRRLRNRRNQALDTLAAGLDNISGFLRNRPNNNNNGDGDGGRNSRRDGDDGDGIYDVAVPFDDAGGDYEFPVEPLGGLGSRRRNEPGSGPDEGPVGLSVYGRVEASDFAARSPEPAGSASSSIPEGAGPADPEQVRENKLFYIVETVNAILEETDEDIAFWLNDAQRFSPEQVESLSELASRLEEMEHYALAGSGRSPDVQQSITDRINQMREQLTGRFLDLASNMDLEN